MACVWLEEEQEAIGTPRKLVGKESSLEQETFKLGPEGLMGVMQLFRGWGERNCEATDEPREVITHATPVCAHTCVRVCTYFEECVLKDKA